MFSEVNKFYFCSTEMQFFEKLHLLCVYFISQDKMFVSCRDFCAQTTAVLMCFSLNLSAAHFSPFGRHLEVYRGNTKPSAWHSYVHKFIVLNWLQNKLYSNLARPGHLLSSLKELLKDLTPKKIIVLLKLAEPTWYLHGFIKYKDPRERRMNVRPAVFAVKVHNPHTVPKPELDLQDILYSPIDRYRTRSRKLVLQYLLHVKLRLRFTVLEMKVFPMRTIKGKCLDELTMHFLVGSWSPRGARYKHTLMRDISRESFTLCGYFSNFPLYPPTHKTEIILRSSSIHSQYWFSALSDVIEPNIRIHSFLRTSKNNFTQAIIEQRLNQQLYVYHIRASNFQFVQVLLERAGPVDVHTFDGPGVLSRHLQQTGSTWNSSGFQCVIHLVTKHGSDPIIIIPGLLSHNQMPTDFVDMFFKTHNQGATATHVVDTPVVLQYPRRSFSKTDSIFHKLEFFILKVPFQTKENYLNVSIPHFQYQGPEDVDCPLGGTTFYEVDKGGSNKLLTSLCVHTIPEASNLQKVFSTTPTMLVAIFSYQSYTQLKLTLRAQSTQCTSVKINICYQNKTLDDTPTLLHHTCTVVQLVTDIHSKETFASIDKQGPKVCTMSKNLNIFKQKLQVQKEFKVLVKGFFSNNFVNDENRRQYFRVKGKTFDQNKQTNIKIIEWTGNTSQVLNNSQLNIFGPICLTTKQRFERVAACPDSYRLREDLGPKEYYRRYPKCISNEEEEKFALCDLQIGTLNNKPKRFELLFYERVSQDKFPPEMQFTSVRDRGWLEIVLMQRAEISHISSHQTFAKQKLTELKLFVSNKVLLMDVLKNKRKLNSLLNGSFAFVMNALAQVVLAYPDRVSKRHSAQAVVSSAAPFFVVFQDVVFHNTKLEGCLTIGHWHVTQPHLLNWTATFELKDRVTVENVLFL